jgi:hypothetical protein
VRGSSVTSEKILGAIKMGTCHFPGNRLHYSDIARREENMPIIMPPIPDNLHFRGRRGKPTPRIAALENRAEEYFGRISVLQILKCMNDPRRSSGGCALIRSLSAPDQSRMARDQTAPN